MANRAGKNIDFPGLVANGENPAGLAVHAPSGTYYPTKDDVAGGDGREYPWNGNVDSARWGHNPMPERCCDPFAFIPDQLPKSRKLRK